MDPVHLLDGYNFSRNRKVYAEFQCLQMCASCQLLAADAGGETQIIFYLLTSACLSSWRHPFDDSRAESFGSRINCGRESCGTSSDDSHIADHFGIREFCDDQR